MYPYLGTVTRQYASLHKSLKSCTHRRFSILSVTTFDTRIRGLKAVPSPMEPGMEPFLAFMQPHHQPGSGEES